MKDQEKAQNSVRKCPDVVLSQFYNQLAGIRLQSANWYLRVVAPIASCVENDHVMLAADDLQHSVVADVFVDDQTATSCH